jgi:DNA end-binding protein Ku
MAAALSGAKGPVMARAVWKGAISFGLVHLPVALYPASQDSGIDFDWLDRRSLDPVGYKRYNKRTGRELKSADIVKGVKQPGGGYVVVSDEEVRAAFPRSTRTIEIASFVKQAEVSPMALERPYYVQPTGKADKVYVLLRETMREAGVIAIARIVMHTKEHLTALMVDGEALVLNTLRWPDELRSPAGLGLPGKRAAGAEVKPAERKMAAQLVAEMTTPWKPGDYSEHFGNAIRQLIRRKVATGKTRQVEPLEEQPLAAPSNVVDLSELLAKSLRASRAPASGSGAAHSDFARRQRRRAPRARRERTRRAS